MTHPWGNYRCPGCHQEQAHLLGNGGWQCRACGAMGPTFHLGPLLGLGFVVTQTHEPVAEPEPVLPPQVLAFLEQL